jgi:hypothetical protein
MEGWYIDDVVVEHFFPADAVAGDAQPGFLPETVVLSQNFPNPFNPTTTIEFTLPYPQKIRLTVYNLRGQQVMTMVNGFEDAGRHKVQLDGSQLASGLYFYRLDAGRQTVTRKMLLVK